MTDLCFFFSFLEKIRQTAGITAVFVNVQRLSPLSEVSLRLKKALWLHGERFHALAAVFFIHTEGAGGSLGG